MDCIKGLNEFYVHTLLYRHKFKAHNLMRCVFTGEFQGDKVLIWWVGRRSPDVIKRVDNKRILGYKKTLCYYTGPNRDTDIRTLWYMTEYMYNTWPNTIATTIVSMSCVISPISSNFMTLCIISSFLFPFCSCLTSSYARSTGLMLEPISSMYLGGLSFSFFCFL